MKVHISEEMRRLLTDLAKLPVMSMAQAVTYFSNRPALARHEIMSLSRMGLISLSSELVRGRHFTPEPIFRLVAGGSILSAGSVACSARKRWSDEFRPMEILRASARVELLVGIKPPTSPRSQVSHDLALSDLLLHKKHAFNDFTFEIVTPKPGQVLPDAVSGTVALEMLGAYSSVKIQAKMTIARTFGTVEFY